MIRRCQSKANTLSLRHSFPKSQQQEKQQIESNQPSSKKRIAAKGHYYNLCGSTTVRIIRILRTRMDLRRHHFQVIVVTLVAVVLVWTTLSSQSSLDYYHSLVSDQNLKTTAASSSRADHLYHHDYDGRSVHSSSTTTFSTTRPHWIDSYIQWHQEQLRFNATKYSFVMYSCIRHGGACGGIGDRLNGMVQSFYTAMCHRRVFLIQYDTPFPLTVALQPNHIRWNATPGGQNIPSVVERIDWMNVRSYPSLIEPNVLQEKEDLRKARGWLIRCNLWMEKTMPTSKCLQQYIQEQEENYRPRSSNPSAKKERQSSSRNDPFVPDADDLYRWAFDALFQLAEPVMERTRQIQQRTGLAINTTSAENTPTYVDITQPDDGAKWNVTSTTSTSIVTSNDQHSKKHPIVSLQPYVAMHIRTGRGSTWSGDPLRHSGNQTLLKFRECAMRMQQHLMAIQKRQILAAAATRTNSTQQQNALGSIHNHRVDSMASPSLPLIYVASDNVAIKQQFEDWDNTSFRFDHLLNVVHVDKTQDPSLDSYLDAWAEMVVLWQAKALVMSVSKFSQLAAVLGQFTNATARYFDQCDFGESISLQETATPTHHRDQADEKFIEKRRSMRRLFLF